MGIISKMSLHLANMIAAGEVVERPSSVVKELVENAIDAKSTDIKIYIENGGLNVIRVVDNGVGMDSEDVCMAFLPHATSKIKTEYDLTRINTLGFRGEAIASIASVSEMQIISSMDGASGYQCRYAYGVKKEEGVIHSNKGTTVTVKNLFLNTPARLKYMKSAKSELASIMFFLDRIALAHPELRFSVMSDNKLIFQTSGSKDYKTLIAEVYGIEAAKNIMLHKYSLDGYIVEMVLVKPSIYRSNKLEITMICNGRYVKNYNITNAVIDGFQTYLPIGKYPIGILYFTIDPLLVDVNVHPSKTEIKISDEEEIIRHLILEIRKCLEEETHIPTRPLEEKKPESYEKTTIFEYSEDLTFEEKTPQYNSIEKKEEVPQIEKKSNKLPYMEYVGSLFGTYLIFQNEEGMLLMDQHAAQERINYEKFYELLAVEHQPTTELLLPISLEFTKEESLYIEQNKESFNKIGFSLDQVGAKDFVLREVPLWAKLDYLEDIIYDILAMLIQNKKIDIMYFRDAIAKQISCKASIKANHRINREEIQNLLFDLNKCKNPYTCPHGRPTIIKLSLMDIEKMFERIQK